MFLRKPKPGRVNVIRQPNTIIERESINNLRGFIFVVAIMTSGDPNALARANTVISCPAIDTDTFEEAATLSRMPAITYSDVLTMKVMNASM
ncbi:hypothetical protein J7E79_01445 [Bacillus sp. ISL-40]|nr:MULTISPECIES: hypothetical protein [unclassified Bacillus (in: firmicutes)]MBT2696107.1 hypothetical protein [Bacillus sp. ISL-40]MBT2744063.1 hypothetical protein [Bacillus sp. ISL-77]